MITRCCAPVAVNSSLTAETIERGLIVEKMIQLRDARHDELPGLSELCLRSKAVWGYDDAFMTACRTELTLRPDELQSTLLLEQIPLNPSGIRRERRSLHIHQV